MMAGGRPKASGGGKWRYLLPALVGCHLFLSFCFVQYFMPSDTPGMGLSLGNANDQVKISNLQKELAAAREALHERHRDEEGEEEGEERRGAGRAGRRAELRRVAGGVGGTPAKIKSLSWNFPTSSEPTELKETASVKEEPDGGYDSKPFFSIIIAAYNQGAFLEETFKSIVAQKYDRWEVILVNDGSTDDTWEVAQRLTQRFFHSRVRVITKPNGGLADARNVGLRYAKGNWLCMLDSDDLLGKDYLQRAADFVLEDDHVDIIPGCMRNFDAVSSEWCFPEGFSVLGIAHWNKFHASVLMSRRLMAGVGGYDPGIPWGLEDWNYWLSTVPHNPIVRFVPETTFYYRHHAGTSMRKKMFSLYLEETKAMVRTNHAELYEPMQILLDHDTITRQHADTLGKLDEKIQKYPSLPMPYFWRALLHAGKLNNQLAKQDFEHALMFAKTPGQMWQINYRLALLCEALGDTEGAEAAINAAFKHAYFNEILLTKHRVEAELKAAVGVDSRPLLASGHVTTKPTYWDSAKEQEEIREGTLAGKLERLSKLQAATSAAAAREHKLVALLATANDSPCPPFTGVRGGQAASSINLVHDGSFESEGDGWHPYGQGFTLDSPRPRGGTASELSAVMTNEVDSVASGAMQVVHLRQDVAAPVLIRAWSKAQGVSGANPADYSLYMDINFVDNTHEWAFTVPFDKGTHGWQQRSAYLHRDKPIASLDLYCMFRNHDGTVWFDDVVVAPAAQVTCQCRRGEVYDPAPGKECSPCPPDQRCMLGDTIDQV